MRLALRSYKHILLQLVLCRNLSNYSRSMYERTMSLPFSSLSLSSLCLNASNMKMIVASAPIYLSRSKRMYKSVSRPSAANSQTIL